MTQPLVEIHNLHAEIVTFDGVAQVLNGVNLTLYQGELLGLVGETGCGKSVTAMTIPRLAPQPPARYPQGEVRFRGENVLAKSGEALRRLRAQHIGVVFQDPMTGLNPVFTIAEQMSDAILSRQNQLGDGLFQGWRSAARVQRRAARHRAIELLERVTLESDIFSVPWSGQGCALRPAVPPGRSPPAKRLNRRCKQWEAGNAWHVI